MSTSLVGAASLSFISGRSEWPPARSLASSPPSVSAAMASSTDSARWYSNAAGITIRSLLTGWLGLSRRRPWPCSPSSLPCSVSAGPEPPFCASWIASHTRIGVSGMSM